MTDKEQIKSIIKQYADKGERLFLEASESNESYVESYWDGYKDCANGLLRELEDIQEEPEYLEEETTYCAFSTSRYTDKERKSLCKGCEEECEFKPVTSVWHDANEIPTDKSKVIVWLGEELNEIVQCHYMYGKFVEKIPTEEYGRYVLIGNEIEGYSRQFVSNKKRADLTELVVKWAYIKDLLKL